MSVGQWKWTTSYAQPRKSRPINSLASSSTCPGVADAIRFEISRRMGRTSGTLGSGSASTRERNSLASDPASKVVILLSQDGAD